jgi:hypothetical protein
VAPRRLQHVLDDCRKTLRECRLFAADAGKWSLPGSSPHISKKKRDWITELAFLRAFLALESFLEESFILYSLGHEPPRGRPPHRFVFPPSRKAADALVKLEGRRHVSWTASEVSNRAKMFFRDGRPFVSALSTTQNTLNDARTIRNAIAHESIDAQQSFETLVRSKLGALPAGLSVGGFLSTPIPSSNPSQSFLELYLTRIELVATQIVPSP